MFTSLSDRRSAIGIGLAFAILEITMVPWLEEPMAAIVFAVLFAATATWTWRGGRGGLVALAVLCALELAFVPFYPRVAFEDWIFQGLTLVLSLAGLAISVAVLRQRSGARLAA